MLGLVLTAGGARGAYQAGVLRRIGELPSLRDGPSPFPIVTGASAGAINGATIAAGSESFHDATRELARLWASLEVAHVFRADAFALVTGALRLLRDLALGPIARTTLTRSFLDATPLRPLLARVLALGGIGAGIRAGRLYAVAILATSYHSGRSFIFVQGARGHPVWMKSRRVVLPVELTVDHVCASAAIPLVFPPVPVRCGDGALYFGDGGLRLTTPLSPAIRLGATHVLAIGIRSQRAANALGDEELGTDPSERASNPICPPLAQICGVFLNAIFLDHLDSDLDHLRRMNELILAHSGDGSLAAGGGSAGPPHSEPMRIISPLAIGPSEDLALVAQRFAHRMPRAVRYLLEGLGTPDAQSADLMSYLLFDSHYTRTLLQIGYRDASERIDEIEAFLHSRGQGDAAGESPESPDARTSPPPGERERASA
jgi:NTE family protein